MWSDHFLRICYGQPTSCSTAWWGLSSPGASPWIQCKQHRFIWSENTLAMTAHVLQQGPCGLVTLYRSAVHNKFPAHSSLSELVGPRSIYDTFPLRPVQSLIVAADIEADVEALSEQSLLAKQYIHSTLKASFRNQFCFSLFKSPPMGCMNPITSKCFQACGYRFIYSLHRKNWN